jgi:hypothetical protein
MLLEITLAEDHDDLGKKGDNVLVNDNYIVAIKKVGTSRATMFIDLSDLDPFTEVLIEEDYEKWYMLRLNV